MASSVCVTRSKRKHITRCQEVPITSNENLSYNISKTFNKEAKKKQVKNHPIAIASKENAESPHRSRKSERHRKSTCKNNFIYNLPKKDARADILSPRCVLSDKTNAPFIEYRSKKKWPVNEEKPIEVENKNMNATNVGLSSQSNESHDKECIGKLHIPVYRIHQNDDILDNPCKFSTTKTEAVYEFDEVDENEVPAKKKKRRKRPYVKRNKIGPKALTINNIKYSSTESLVSLPEKPVRRKKIFPKVNPPSIASSTSLKNISDTESTSYSVQSVLCPQASSIPKGTIKKKHELSVLQETQSENISFVHESSYNKTLPETMMNNNFSNMPSNSSLVLPDENQENLPPENCVFTQQRCYPSKKSFSDRSHGISQCSSIDTLHNQLSHYSANVSTSSLHDFLSSTPCKKTSLVVCHNSVFNETCDTDIPDKFRPSTGFGKTPQGIIVDDDNCFGFDESEELEEPLVSPIKNINLPEPKILPRHQHELFTLNEMENPKLDPKEVIEMLKATITKTKAKEQKISDVYNSDTSRNQSNLSSPNRNEVETTLSFTKPPRRSYERQRRVRYYSEHEEEEESEEESNEIEQGLKNDVVQESEIVPKPSKKFYQKRNVSKVVKAPAVPKAKQKIIKEEEELERLAAQLNAQFQQIDKCNLVVE